MDEGTRSPDRTNDGVRSIGVRQEAGGRQYSATNTIATNTIATNTIAAPVTRFPAETSSTANAPAPMHDIAALLAVSGAVAEPPKPAPPARLDLRDEFQAEIKARVANFRAHQERFSREREAFCSATMAKVHASIKESELPPRLGN